MERTATCSCGQLSVTVAGEPAYAGVCHCLECQKSTGSAFSLTGYWPHAAVKGIAGTSAVWRRTAASGRWLDNHFCPTCGSTVYAYAAFDPDTVGISIGNFADPAFPPPEYAVWCETRHPWVQLPETCRLYDRQPDG